MEERKYLEIKSIKIILFLLFKVFIININCRKNFIL